MFSDADQRGIVEGYEGFNLTFHNPFRFISKWVEVLDAKSADVEKLVQVFDRLKLKGFVIWRKKNDKICVDFANLKALFEGNSEENHPEWLSKQGIIAIELKEVDFSKDYPVDIQGIYIGSWTNIPSEYFIRRSDSTRETRFKKLEDTAKAAEAAIQQIKEALITLGIAAKDQVEAFNVVMNVVSVFRGDSEDIDGDICHRFNARAGIAPSEIPTIPKTSYLERPDGEEVIPYLRRVWRPYLWFGFATLAQLEESDPEAFAEIPWPLKSYREEIGEFDGNLEAYLSARWESLVEVGVATRQVLADRDPPLAAAIAHRQGRGRGPRGPIPENIRPPSVQDLNNRALTAEHIPVGLVERLAYKVKNSRYSSTTNGNKPK